MKTLKLALLAIMFIVMALIAIAEINHTKAIQKAQEKETDGEIEQILREHGFQVDIYQEITPEEKLKAIFR